MSETTTSWVLADEHSTFSHDRTVRLARAVGTWLARHGIRQCELHRGCAIDANTAPLHDSVVTGLLLTGIALTRFPTWQSPLPTDAVPDGVAAVVLRAADAMMAIEVFSHGVRLDESQRLAVDAIAAGDLWAFGAASLTMAPARGW